MGSQEEAFIHSEPEVQNSVALEKKSPFRRFETTNLSGEDLERRRALGYVQ